MLRHLLRRLAGLLLRWPVSVAVGGDIFLSALFFGAPYQTVSARLGRRLHLKRCRWTGAFCALLSRLLGKDHCQESWQVYKAINQITGDEK